MKIKDIAEKAGVSTATVSNVLNGNYHKVSQPTVKKIQKIIEELNYTPSAVARNLATKESRIIGVVAPNLSESDSFGSDPYISQVIGTLESYVRRQGYYLLIRSVEKCQEIPAVLSAWNIDGAIFLSSSAAEAAALESTLDIPAVYLDTYAPKTPIANVGIDDYGGGFLAAKYLLAKGHRKIALVSPSITPGVVEERYRGFTDAMKERGVAFDQSQLFEVQTRSAEGIEAGRRIAVSGQKFTAVAVMSDIVAVGVMDGLRKYGLNIPEDISVIGFDNLFFSRYTYPALTTIAQDVDAKATAAAELLFRMIAQNQKIVENRMLDVEIVERQSVKNLNL